MQSSDINSPSNSQQILDVTTVEAIPSNLRDAYISCSSKKKLCFSLPDVKCIDAQNCEVLFTSISVSKERGDVEIELYWKREADSSNRWVATALSSDQKMGDDSVTECILAENGTVFVLQGWNVNAPYHTENVNMTGITVNHTSYANGVVYCQWRRSGSTEVRGHTFNILKDNFYLMLAYGPMKDQS